MASGPISTVADMTWGVNEDHLTSRILPLYCFFSYSCLRLLDFKEVALFDRALGLKTLNVFSNRPPQTLQAKISSRAPGSELAVLCTMITPVKGLYVGEVPPEHYDTSLVA